MGFARGDWLNGVGVLCVLGGFALGAFTVLGQSLYWLYFGEWLPFGCVEVCLWLELPPDHSLAVHQLLPAFEYLRQQGPRSEYGDLTNWFLSPQTWRGLHYLVGDMGLGSATVLTGWVLIFLGIATEK